MGIAMVIDKPTRLSYSNQRGLALKSPGVLDICTYDNFCSILCEQIFWFVLSVTETGKGNSCVGKCTQRMLRCVPFGEGLMSVGQEK